MFGLVRAWSRPSGDPADADLARTLHTLEAVQALKALRLTPNPGQVVVWSGGLEGRLVGLSGQVVFVL